MTSLCVHHTSASSLNTLPSLQHFRDGKGRETEGLCVHHNACLKYSRGVKSFYIPNKCVLETHTRRESLFSEAHFENSRRWVKLEIEIHHKHSLKCPETRELVCSVQASKRGLKPSRASRLMHLLQAHAGNSPSVFITSTGSNLSRNAKTDSKTSA